MEYLKRLLVGRPLKSAENDEQKLTRKAALALLSSDALSSIAYGTEQIVVVLVALSAAAIWYSLPIAAFVIILLISLTLSYRQIIHAYPHGGGAYVVSSENLGKNAGLIAGGSLLIDYMLTVAVSVSAGGGGGSDYFCRTRSIWASGGYLDHYCFTDHDDELTGVTRICEFLDGSCIHLYRCDHDLDSCRII